MKKSVEYDIISLEEAHELLLMKQREHILSSFTFPTKPGKDGYYFIWVPDPVKKSGRRHLAAKSVDALKDKVYDFVTHAPELKVSRKFNEVFEAANDSQLDLITKESASLSKKNTILRNRSEYKRYFSETDFENHFIDDITAQDIKGTHSFRRNAITDTLALNGGDAVQAALIYGNSPQVIFSNYLTGTDMNKAKEVLNRRNLLNTKTAVKTD